MLDHKNLIKKIPREILKIIKTLEKKGFEAYLVGGCVRDILIGNDPKDWDITTNATPEEIIPLYKKIVYENNFGTVMVINEDVTHETFRKVEITPYRLEGKYTDHRRPDQVVFSKNLEDDLKRRDFSINAMAFNLKGHLTDIFNGLKDIEKKIIRTVGDPDYRFKEDALRMLRAVRFAVQLNFTVSHETTESIFRNAFLIKEISNERIRDELQKIIMSPYPAVGITMLHKLGLLKYIIPELEEGIGCEQSGEHIYDVWNHSLHAVQHSADKNWPLEVRFSALFHDIGKPRTRRFIKNDNSLKQNQNELQRSFSRKKYTFYGHEVVGARMAKKIMERLKFSKKESELVEKLIYSHMFFSDTEKITISAVRRIITKVGKENIWLLMNVRECDRVGMKKKETPYRLRKYFAMIEEALRDPVSVSQLKIDGNYMIKDMGMKPSKRVGWILNSLLEEVLDDPKKNTTLYLSKRAKELDLLSDINLQKIGEKAKEKKEELEKEEIEKLHKKHNVS